MKRSTRTDVRRSTIDNYTYSIDYPSHEIFCKRYPYKLKSLYVTKDGRLFFHITDWEFFHSENIIPCTKEEAKEFLMSECEVIADFVNFVADDVPKSATMLDGIGVSTMQNESWFTDDFNQCDNCPDLDDKKGCKSHGKGCEGGGADNA